MPLSPADGRTSTIGPVRCRRDLLKQGGVATAGANRTQHAKRGSITAEPSQPIGISHALLLRT